MTDTKIIKALECCIKAGTFVCYESECPLFGRNCISELTKNALDLINRQRAEIENLREDNEILKNYVNFAKSEEIKEFAERLKKAAYPFPCAIGVENAVTIRAINDLVKEMGGATE